MNLDKNQQEAVKAEEKKVLVIAAPGSGKTSVLLGRCIYLINKGIPAENILMLTFTKSAADNMKDRLEKENIKLLPFIGTFHSFLYRILMRKQKINLIQEQQKDILIKEILKEFQDDIKDTRIREIKNGISKYKRNKVYDGQIGESTFYYIYERYSSYLYINSLADFDDLEIKGVKAIADDKVLLEKLKTKFKYILIDEFQDTDDLEIEFLNLIGEKASLFFVGDEDQCIFTFRGSNPQYTYNFRNEFKGGKIYCLNINYRSRSNIVKASEKLIKNNVKRSSKKIGMVKQGGTLKVIKAKDNKEEAEKILNLINELTGSIGILYRNKKDAEFLALYLLNNNIFYNYYEDPLKEIRNDINSYIKLSENRFSKELFKNIINKPNRFISRLSLIKLDRVYLEKDVFKTLYSMDFVSKAETENIRDLEKKLNKLNKINGCDKVRYIIESLDYSQYLEKKFKANDFSNLINNFNGVKESRLTLSTIHKAKGTEYENIIILNCHSLKVNSFRNSDMEEERRIFYVALTRGISNVYFITREEGSCNFVNEANCIITS